MKKIKIGMILCLSVMGATTVVVPTAIALSESKTPDKPIEPDKPVTRNFETDPWETVCFYANQGYNALYEAYKHTSSFRANHFSFLGMKRNIEIGDINHTVRVIGEEEDFLADEKGNPTQTAAALTFDSVNIWCTYDQDRQRYWPESTYYDNNSIEWTTSLLRERLNDFLDVLPSVLKSSVKTVSKKTLANADAGKSKAYIKNSAERIFALSLSEIYTQEALDKYCDEPQKLEGSQYEYFKLMATDTDLPITMHNNIVRKTWIGALPYEIMPSGVNYFLRTPSFNRLPDDTTNCVTIIDDYCLIKNMLSIDVECAIAPVFCI